MVTEARSSSPEETLEIGRDLGRRLKGNEIILLSGELGSGKTLLAKGIASGLGIPASEVVSPSFTLMNVHHGRINLYHFDLYRLGRENRRVDPDGIDEYIGQGVIVVEWAQYLDKSFFALKEAITIELTGSGDQTRLIRIRAKPKSARRPASTSIR